MSVADDFSFTGLVDIYEEVQGFESSAKTLTATYIGVRSVILNMDKETRIFLDLVTPALSTTRTYTIKEGADSYKVKSVRFLRKGTNEVIGYDIRCSI